MKLKIIELPDEKPVKVSVELPAAVHRDLLVYSELLANEAKQPVGNVARLIAAMVAHFIATDRAFAKARHAGRKERTAR
jgi:hypothetical protein